MMSLQLIKQFGDSINGSTYLLSKGRVKPAVSDQRLGPGISQLRTQQRGPMMNLSCYVHGVNLQVKLSTGCLYFLDKRIEDVQHFFLPFRVGDIDTTSQAGKMAQEQR
jgi:hypothetical protein